MHTVEKTFIQIDENTSERREGKGATRLNVVKQWAGP